MINGSDRNPSVPGNCNGLQLVKFSETGISNESLSLHESDIYLINCLLLHVFYFKATPKWSGDGMVELKLTI